MSFSRYRIKMDSDLEHWLVFFNGEFLALPLPTQCSSQFRVLAVDGGLSCMEKYGLNADVFVGDMDSSRSDQIPEEALILPKEKDFLDGEAALHFLEGMNPRRVDIYNFLQGRWDMSICHIQSLPRFTSLANRTHIHTESSEIIYCDLPLNKTAERGQSFSLIPLEPMKSVTIRGTRYDISEKDLRPGFGFSLSNEVAGEEVSIEFEGRTPYLLEFHDRGAI